MSNIKRSNVIYNTFFYTLAMMLPQLVSFVYLPILTRYISPEEQGIYAYTSSVSSVMAIISALGLNSYYLKQYAASGDKEELNGTLFYFIIIWSLLIGIVETIIFSVIWPGFNMKFGFYPYMFLAIITNFFNSFEIIPMRTFRIRGEAQNYFIRTLVKSLLTVALYSYFIIYLKCGILGKYYSELINSFGFSIVFLIYMFRCSKHHINWKLLKTALIFSAPMLVSGILQLGTPMMVNVVVERACSLVEVGLFSVGLNISNVIKSITQSVMYSIEPDIYRFTDEYHTDKRVGLGKKIYMIVTMLLCMGCGLFIYDAVILLLDERYYSVWRIEQVLALSHAVSGLREYLSTVCVAQSRQRIVPYSNAVLLAVFVAIGSIVIPRWGADSIGWVYLGAWTASLGVLCSRVKDLHMYDLKKDFLAIVVLVSVNALSGYLNRYGILLRLLIKAVCFAIGAVLFMKIYGLHLRGAVGYLLGNKK